MDWEVYHGDCLEELKELPEGCIDSVVTDPPYGIGFMGKKWDTPGALVERPADRSVTWDKIGGNHNPTDSADAARTRRAEGRKFQSWCEMWARELFRVLKPGGHLLAFGGTRTYHRMACAIEDAGFEIRDSLHWMYGSGFPKSLDVSKAIDKDEGFWRGRAGSALPHDSKRALGQHYEATPKGDPVTAAAAAWLGWGTALKPAHEPIVLARKPLVGTVAANVLAHGTGALNIDACRLDPRGKQQQQGQYDGAGAVPIVGAAVRDKTYGADLGRWPANMLVDDYISAWLREQAAFFYVCKPSRREREEGLDDSFPAVSQQQQQRESGALAGLISKSGAEVLGRKEGSAGLNSPRAGAGRTAQTIRNTHATVKPIQLMRYLVRLITPPGGVVLDPFAGSGTTGCAAALEGFDFYGIEREEDHVAIARARIAHWAAKKAA